MSLHKPSARIASEFTLHQFKIHLLFFILMNCFQIIAHQIETLSNASFFSKLMNFHLEVCIEELFIVYFESLFLFQNVFQTYTFSQILVSLLNLFIITVNKCVAKWDICRKSSHVNLNILTNTIWFFLIVAATLPQRWTKVVPFPFLTIFDSGKRRDN